MPDSMREPISARVDITCSDGRKFGYNIENFEGTCRLNEEINLSAQRGELALMSMADKSIELVVRGKLTFHETSIPGKDQGNQTEFQVV